MQRSDLHSITTMAENAEENARPVPKEAQSETLVEDTCALEQETTTEEPTTRELPARPIKRARTAYFVFADDKRAEIAAQHPGEGVGALAKVMSKLWSSLSHEDKAVYQQQALEERERVSKLAEQYKDAMPDHTMDNAASAAKANASVLQLPAARIRKICRLDPEVKGLSKEALQLITRCAECMTVKLGMESSNVAQLQNRRTILPDDVAHVCANREAFLFLKEDMRDFQKQLSTEKVDRKREGKITTSHITTAAKPLSDYFQRQT